MPPRKAKTQRGSRSQQVADTLHSGAIHLLRRLRRLDDKTDLSAPQLSALSVLVFGGPLTLGSLAAAEQVRPASMTAIVRQLESAGLVRRESDPEDGRRTILWATSSGQRILRAGRSRRVAQLAGFIRTLGKDDAQTLQRAAELMKEFAQQAADVE